MALPETLLPPTGDPEREDMVRLAASMRTAEVVTSDGAHIELSGKLSNLLHDVIDAMSHGKAVTVTVADDLLTTQEAADILSISRPTLIRLMEVGEISYELRGKHRRVRHADVLDYQKRNRKARKDLWDNMAREYQDFGDDPGMQTFPTTR